MFEIKSRAEELFARIESDGYEAIKKLIEDRQAESLFLDFKQSANKGDTDKIHQNDRDNLAKAISGFGNGEGGIVIWGVDCRNTPGQGDVASAEVRIVNPKRFASLLTGIVSGCTIPPHRNVLSHPIDIDESGTGFVATYIAASESAPHQAAKEYKYYMRSGSDFQPVPHGILAGMFGRRPQPKLNVRSCVTPYKTEGGALTFTVDISIQNLGPGIAHHPYVSTFAKKTVGQLSKIRLETPPDGKWSQLEALGRWVTVIGLQYTILPPGAMCVPLAIHIEVRYPFTEGLEIEIIVGCEGVEPQRLTYGSTVDVVSQAYADAFLNPLQIMDPTDPTRHYHELPARILGLEFPKPT